ncbi:sensor histidine kinase [Thermorudis peleae]|uniref:sensor histidine kinase n=1 Tax=Thermorudis peleae TaxID=1382356 RepID=UPI00068E1EB3|nr:ATP-binding protein [Thermorudis peleae]
MPISHPQLLRVPSWVLTVFLPILLIPTTTARLMLGLALGVLVGLLIGWALAWIRVARALNQHRRWLRDQFPPAASLESSAVPTASALDRFTREWAACLQSWREQAQRAQAERDQLYRILEHLNEGIVISDEADRVYLLNRMAASLLRTTPRHATGRALAEVVRDYELVELVAEARRKGIALSHQVIELGRPPRAVHALASRLPSPRGSFVTLILRDVTELRRTETVRRDFIANVSHDLRTPLAGLQALVDTLLDGALDDPAVARDFLQRIAVEVAHLTQLVNQLLDLSRAESGQLTLQRRPTDLNRLARDVVERFQPRAQAQGLALTVVTDPSVPCVDCDPGRISQVLANLLDNALKFTPAGGQVTVRVARDGDAVLVTVSDTGPGIPPEDLDRVFERFYKSDRARSSSGSGLGLAIVKHLVQLHGGTVWAENAPGGGAQVTVRLPISLPTPPDVTRRERSTP